MLLTLLAAVLGFVTVAGFGFALAGGSGSERAAKRAQALVARGAEGRDTKVRRATVSAQDNRRRQILKTLKDQEKEQKKATVNLAARLRQAGLGESVRTFWIVSGVVGVLVFLVALILRQPAYVGLGLAFAAGLGLPRWVVGLLGKVRVQKFVDQFPDAMDVITRGIKSGLPVHDSLRVIGQETADPLASEFRILTENMSMGMGMDQAVERMYQRMPTPEVRFFGIVMAIQSKTGGNLAEALGNLSSVIRARKLMKEKVKALSGEAVASAFIIGALPPGVVGLISVIAPAYMEPLFTDPRGRLILLGGAMVMGAGIFVMRKMINFKI